MVTNSLEALWAGDMFPTNTNNTKMESPTTTTVGVGTCVLFYYGLPGMTQLTRKSPIETISASGTGTLDLLIHSPVL